MSADELTRLAARAREIAAVAEAAAVAGQPTAMAEFGRAPTSLNAPGADVFGRARIGLVLAGGGAKGAYQAGVVQCLADARIRIDAVAGCSIGALNGAVVAAAPDLRVAAARLTKIWREVSDLAGPAVPLSQLSGPPVLADVLRAISDLAARAACPVLDPDFLAGFVRARVDADELRRGKPLWISVFPAAVLDPALADWGWLVDIVRGWAGAGAEWLHVNSLPAADVHQAILASAALPPILPSRRVQGRAYRDGGLADVTAAGALVAHGQCDLIIVAHLTRGELWDAHQYPDVPIIEVRPRVAMHDPGLVGGLTSTLDFSPERMTARMRQGYADTADALNRAARVLGSVDARRRGQAAMLEAIAELTGDRGDGEDS
jgi:NTE family protein